MSTLLLLSLAGALAQDPAYDGTKAVADAEKPETDLIAELGSTFVWGNAFVVTANGGVSGFHQWGKNKFSFGGAVNLTLSKPDVNGNGTAWREGVTVDENGDPVTDADGDVIREKVPLQFNSEKYGALVRYDRAFGKNDANSFFISGAFERDRFAGLLWRFNQQIGYRRVIVKTDSTSLDTEIGISANQESLDDQIRWPGKLDAVYPAARLFIGFQHNFNDKVSMGDRVEAIENLLTPVDFRLNNSLWLAAKLNSMFSLKISYNLAFDNLPASPQFSKIDMTTGLTLVATIF